MIYTLYNVISILNIILVILLLAIFTDNYRRIKAPFTLGLIIFALILLVNTLLSCPIVQSCGGGLCTCGNIYFHAGASLFEFFALLLLLYLVRK